MTQTHTKKKELEKISIYIKILLLYIYHIYQKSCIFAQAWLISKKNISLFLHTMFVALQSFCWFDKKNLRKKKSPLKQKKACPYASYTECYGWKTFKFFAWLKFFLRILKPNLCRNTPFHPPKKEVKKWSLFVCFLWSPAHFLHMNCM